MVDPIRGLAVRVALEAGGHHDLGASRIQQSWAEISKITGFQCSPREVIHMQRHCETQTPLTLPPDTHVAAEEVPGWGFFVFLVRSPRRAGSHLLINPASLTVTISHEAGMRWPDRGGERLTELALAADSVAIWIFATGPDAIRAYSRISRAIRWRALARRPYSADLHLVD